MANQTMSILNQEQANWQSYIPNVAWGTLSLFFGYIICYLLVLNYALNGTLSYLWATPCCAYLAYVGFTIVHDAGHGSIFKTGSPLKWLESVLGWVASVPLLLVPFPLFKAIHDRHHAFTNDPHHDPDHFVLGEKWYQVILNCLLIPIQYHVLAFTTLRKNPIIRRTYPTTVIYFTCVFSGLFWIVKSGYLTEAFYLLLLPNVIAVFSLAMFFDYLPHHPHKSLARYQNTRVYPSKLLNILLLGQNYHLVHHLYPKVPWYKYRALYSVLLPELRENNAPIEDIFNNTNSFLTSKFTEQISNDGRSINMLVKVKSITSLLLGNAVLVEFTLPHEQRLKYQAGQYITVCCNVNGKPITRCYSICSSPTSDVLQIGVKMVEGGAMSSFINYQLTTEQEMIVKGPFGDFVYPPRHEYNVEQLMLIAGGSGITPIISILLTALTSAIVKQVQLIYTVACQDDLMFKVKLSELMIKYSDRLHITYIFTKQIESRQQPDESPKIFMGKRLDESILIELLRYFSGNIQQTDFYICGPSALNSSVINTLNKQDISAERIHSEQFSLEEVTLIGKQHNVDIVLADGQCTRLEVAANQTVLNVAKAKSLPVQYACGNGACGSCKCKVEEGKVTLLPDNISGITKDEQLQGYTLMCQCKPVADIKLVEM